MHPFDPTCLSSLELLWFEMVLHGTYLRKVTYDDSLAVYCNDDGTTINSEVVKEAALVGSKLQPWALPTLTLFPPVMLA